MQQLDIIRHSPNALARAYRIAADTERHIERIVIAQLRLPDER